METKFKKSVVLAFIFLGTLATLAGCSQEPFEALNYQGAAQVVKPDGTVLATTEAIDQKIVEFQKFLGLPAEANIGQPIAELKKSILGLEIVLGGDSVVKTNYKSRVGLLTGTCANPKALVFEHTGTLSDVFVKQDIIFLNEKDSKQVYFSCLGAVQKGQPCGAALAVVRERQTRGYFFTLMKLAKDRKSYVPTNLLHNKLHFVKSTSEKAKNCKPEAPAGNNNGGTGVTPITNNEGDTLDLFRDILDVPYDEFLDDIFTFDPNDNGADQPVAPVSPMTI